jgi:hypothetical protein
MRTDPRKAHDAGIELWNLANRYKRVYRSDLSDRMAEPAESKQSKLGFSG